MQSVLDNQTESDPLPPKGEGREPEAPLKEVRISLNSYQNRYGQLQSTLKTLQQALATAQASNNPAEQVNILKRIGLIHCHLEEYAWGVKCLEQALQIAQSIGNKASVGVILNYLGAAYRQTGQNRKALKAYLQALEIFEDSSNKVAIARIFNQLGDVYNNLGESDWARLCCRKALKIFHDLGNSPDGESAALYNMGNAYLQLGRPRQALAVFEQALAIHQKIHNPLGNSYASSNSEATILESIGTAYVKLNQEQQAMVFYQQALEIRQVTSKSPNAQARCLDYIGAVHYKLGNQARALLYHLQALGIMKSLNYTPGGESFSYNTTGYERLLHHLVVVYDRLGLSTQGVKCYQQAVEIVSTFGDNASEEAIWNYCNPDVN